MKLLKLSLVFCVTFLISSCSCNKYVHFNKLDDEISPSKNLINFFKQHPNPKVVVRSGISSSNVTEENKNSYLFDVIEKVLLQNGFVVRDRQLFNRILENNQNTMDYSKLRDKTDTDLIIEVNKLNTKRIYETNKYYTDNGSEGLLGFPYKKNGAEVEFKIILIKNNEFAGTYDFNYTPCSDGKGCLIEESLKSMRKRLLDKKPVTYEGVEGNVMESFMANATKRLVESIKQH